MSSIIMSLVVLMVSQCVVSDVTMQQITVMVQQEMTRRRSLTDQRVVDEVQLNELMNEPLATEYLLKQTSRVSEYIDEALSNGSSLCSIAWKSLSTGTQMIRFSPTYNVTVHKNTVALDACGKPVPEILKGNFLFRGGFDECMGLSTSSYNFSMKYADASLIFAYMAEGSVKPLVLPIPMVESLCIPDVCTFKDINDSLSRFNTEIYNLPLPIKVFIIPTSLHTKASQNDIPLPFSAGAIVMIFISCLFVFLSILGTAYDLFLFYYSSCRNLTDGSINEVSEEKKRLCEVSEEKRRLLGAAEKNTMSHWEIFIRDACESFSLYKTIPAIMSTSQPSSAITSINGLRVISMFWVILGHTYFFYIPFQGYKNVLDVYENYAKKFSAQAVVNAYFSVDSFFFLSGLLVAYLTLREMNKKKGHFPFVSFYVHRFLRLTPTYMFVLFFLWFLAIHITDGPMVLDSLGETSGGYRNCKKYWWTNLLYINNFYPQKFGDQCMGWAWYLANDMQFYVISPLLLIPLFLSLPSGIVALGITLLSSISITGFIAGYYGYPANNLYPAISAKDPLNKHLPAQETEIYGKPYCRIAPYLVGIFLGYLLYKNYQISFRNPRINLLFYGSMWVVAAFTGMVNVYGLYSSFHGHEFSPTENVMYFMLSRFTWGVTLFLVVYACHNGYGGVVDRFLSLPIWVPLSRLTFTTYLVHEVVMIILSGEMRDGLYYTDMNITVRVIANTVLAFGAAAVISVFVEFPLSNLERAVFRLFGKPLRATARTTAVVANNDN